MSGAFVILTAILSSGVIAALISASFSDLKERSVFRRQKIEELYLSSATWLREAEMMFYPYLRVCRGEIPYNDAIDEINSRAEQAKEIGAHHVRMGMNIRMYEPTLLPVFERLEAEQKNLNMMVNLIRDDYKGRGEASHFARPYYEQIKLFGKASENLKLAIIARGNELASEPTFVLKLLGSVKRYFTSTLMVSRQKIDHIRTRIGR